MVSQASYHTQGNNGQRPSRIYSPYVSNSTYHDRRLHIPARDNHAVAMPEHQSDNGDTPARKRIAVACGRCRQRKIRCSGDLGQNMPCSNCKNAGVSQCLFLRVASRETPIQADATATSLTHEFNYNPVAARALAHRSIAPPVPQYLSPTDLSPTEPFKSGSVYSYGGRSYYESMPPWGSNFSSDCVGYSMPASYGAYPVINSNASHLISAYPWESKVKSAPSGLAAINTDPGSYSQGSMTTLVHRPASATDTTAYSLAGFDSALPPMDAETMERVPNVATSTSTPATVPTGPYDHDAISCYKPTSSDTSLVSLSNSLSASGGSSAATHSSTLDSAGVGKPPSPAYVPDEPSVQSSGDAQESYTSSSSYGLGGAGESIFSEQERGLGTQGSTISLSSYTYNSSTAGSLHTSGSNRPSKGPCSNFLGGQTYVPTDSPPPARNHSSAARCVDSPAAYGHTSSKTGVGHHHRHSHRHGLQFPTASRH